jgi:hypothetical protein
VSAPAPRPHAHKHVAVGPRSQGLCSFEGSIAQAWCRQGLSTAAPSAPSLPEPLALLCNLEAPSAPSEAAVSQQHPAAPSTPPRPVSTRIPSACRVQPYVSHPCIVCVTIPLHFGTHFNFQHIISLLPPPQTLHFPCQHTPVNTHHIWDASQLSTHLYVLLHVQWVDPRHDPSPAILGSLDEEGSWAGTHALATADAVHLCGGRGGSMRS